MPRAAWLLIFSFAAVAVSAVLSFTPLAWDLAGRQSESYPEIFFFLYCLPTSVLLLVDAVCLFVWRHAAKTAPGLSWLRQSVLVKVLCLGALAFVAAGPLLPATQRLGQEILNWYYLTALPLQLVLSVIGIVAFMSRDKSQDISAR